MWCARAVVAASVTIAGRLRRASTFGLASLTENVFNARSREHHQEPEDEETG